MVTLCLFYESIVLKPNVILIQRAIQYVLNIFIDERLFVFEV